MHNKPFNNGSADALFNKPMRNPYPCRTKSWEAYNNGYLGMKEKIDNGYYLVVKENHTLT